MVWEFTLQYLFRGEVRGALLLSVRREAPPTYWPRPASHVVLLLWGCPGSSPWCAQAVQEHTVEVPQAPSRGHSGASCPLEAQPPYGIHPGACEAASRVSFPVFHI